MLDELESIMKHDFYQVLTFSYVGSHHIIWNLITIKRKISNTGRFILFNENMAGVGMKSLRDANTAEHSHQQYSEGNCIK
jgi:hypothetical protein